jgi:hypothetical protein
MNQEYDLRKELAASVQKALIRHKVNPEQMGETMRFLGLVLGGMIAKIYPPDEHDIAVNSFVKEIKKGIEKGLPE